MFARARGVAAFAALMTVACSFSNGAATAAPDDKPLRQLTVKLDYTPIWGFMLPIIVAESKGYYRDVGLKVDINEGSDSTSTIGAVDGGHADIGFADAGQAALAIGKGAKVKVIASYLQKTQGVVISYASLGIKKPADLIGKTVALTNGSSSASLLLAMLALSDVPLDKIQTKAIASAAKVPAVLQGQVQAVTGFATAECIQAQMLARSPISCLPMGNFGVTALGESLIASDSLISSDPDLLKKFVQATNRGWADALKDPAAAAEAGVALFSLANARLLKTQLAAVVPYLQTKATVGKPLGYMADSDWAQTLAFLRKYRGMKSTAPTSSFYINVVE